MLLAAHLAQGTYDVMDGEYRKIKRPFPPPASAAVAAPRRCRFAWRTSPTAPGAITGSLHRGNPPLLPGDDSQTWSWRHGRDWLMAKQGVAQMPRRSAGWSRGRKRQAEDVQSSLENSS